MKREHGILIPVIRYCYLLMSVIRALDPPPPPFYPPLPRYTATDTKYVRICQVLGMLAVVRTKPLSRFVKQTNKPITYKLLT